MNRIATGAAVLAVAFADVAPTEASVRVGIQIGSDRPGHYERNGYRSRNNTGRIAFGNGYRDGLREGEKDDRSDDRYNYRDEGRYRDGDSGYRREYGPRYGYVTAYRQGFKEGYRQGYSNHRSYGRDYRNGGQGNRGRR